MPRTSAAQPKPNSGPSPRTLATAFLFVSAALCVVLLATRNLYDDEISSFNLILAPVHTIIQYTATRDLHPPGMYLLSHFAYSILPSFRWLNLFPALLLYASLTVFLLQVTPLFTRTRAQIGILLLATLHPQLLMWGATIRWYGWWTGLALIALTVALQPRDPRPRIGPARGLVLGLLLACLFYLNYITFLFAFALAAAMLLRYRAEPWKRLLVPALLAVAVFGVLIAPQLHTMLTVHLPLARADRAGLAASFFRLLQSIAVSEAYLPWHPLAILAGLVFCALCVAGLAALLRWNRSQAIKPDALAFNSTLASITLFGMLYFLLIAATGLGGKPRNGLLLVPVLAVPAAWIIGTLRPSVQTAILLFFAAWSGVGIAHMIGRTGLTKSNMIGRPEQVVAFIQQTSGDGCAVVVTYDANLAFALDQSSLSRLLILTPFDAATLGAARRLPDNGCAQTTLYAVTSYLGGNSDWEHSLNAELQSSTQFIQGPPLARFFSFDPDAVRKRALARIPMLGRSLADAARLPDYRYVVLSGPIEPASLAAMRQRMPDFISGAGSATAHLTQPSN
jgi:hypothetical protein